MSQKVLSFHYTLTDTSGKTLDSSRNATPFPILEGSKQIIPTLEEELLVMQVGDKKKVEISADKAYGQVKEDLKHEVPRDKLPKGDIKVGAQFRGDEDPNSPTFVVYKIEGETAYLNGNHPLAGVDLVFDVEVMEVREATSEEVEHGHAHGPEGHHHH